MRPRKLPTPLTASPQVQIYSFENLHHDEERTLQGDSHTSGARALRRSVCLMRGRCPLRMGMRLDDACR
jgi:hypothetical protein